MDYFIKVTEKSVSLMKNYYDYVSPFMQIYKENINLKPLEPNIDLDLFKSMIEKYSQ